MEATPGTLGWPFRQHRPVQSCRDCMLGGRREQTNQEWSVLEDRLMVDACKLI